MLHWHGTADSPRVGDGWSLATGIRLACSRRRRRPSSSLRRLRPSSSLRNQSLWWSCHVLEDGGECSLDAAARAHRHAEFLHVGITQQRQVVHRDDLVDEHWHELGEAEPVKKRDHVGVGCLRCSHDARGPGRAPMWSTSAIVSDLDGRCRQHHRS